MTANSLPRNIFGGSIRSPMQVVQLARAVLICALLTLSGCVSSRAERLGTSTYPPRPGDHPIVVFDVVADVHQPFVKVGIVQCSGAPAASWEKMTATLKKQARRLGADAIVLRDEGGGDQSHVVLFSQSGTTFGTATNSKKKSALAIRFEADSVQAVPLPAEGLASAHAGASSEDVSQLRQQAEAGDESAQFRLGIIFGRGEGVPRDNVESIRWYVLAAEQGHASAQFNLGTKYARGDGIPRDNVEAHFWLSSAAASGEKDAIKARANLESRMSASQLAEAREREREIKPRVPEDPAPFNGSPDSSGSGFFITANGYFVTCAHVVAESRRTTIAFNGAALEAKIIQVDPANDLALLKCEGQFAALPLRSSSGVRLGDRVVTLGFPNPDMQGKSPKFSQGEIASMSGPRDDPRFFQVSLPIQPGNSGGPLVDSKGAVVGVVAGRLDQLLALKVTGQLPENVNYAVKGSHLLAFLESVPKLAEQLMEPGQSAVPSEDLPALVEAACAMVSVYH